MLSPLSAIFITLSAMAIGVACGILIGRIKNNAQAAVIDSQNKQIDALNSQASNLNSQIASLTAQSMLTSQEQQRVIEQQQEAMRQKLAEVGDSLKMASEQILKSRAEELSQTNSKEINAILAPLRENIKEMKSALESSRDVGTRNAEQIKQAITDVMLHTSEIGRQADQLSRALRHENKLQGNWGEVILNELLESQGLKRGINYEVQATLTDEQGHPLINEATDSRMVPDVILHYSDDKDIIIDAKTSLSAFIDYNSATSQQDRQDALTRHVKSLRDHVRELAAKDYKRYIRHPRQTVDYMIMFVPVEGALRLALDTDPKLWREALEKGIFISGEQCLTAALRIIHLAWRQELQAQNQRALVEQAENLLERVGQFYKNFTEIGRKLDSLQATYSDTEKKLMTGNQSILVPARRIQKLGHQQSARYPLPAETDNDNEE